MDFVMILIERLSKCSTRRGLRPLLVKFTPSSNPLGPGVKRRGFIMSLCARISSVTFTL